MLGPTRALALFPLLSLLLACNESLPDGEPSDAARIEAAGQAPESEAQAGPAAQSGTPMEDRVATIGVLNKRNNVSEDLQLRPGESQRVGNVEVELQACERTPAWELPKETGAFVQVSVLDRGDDDYRQIFSGWLFKNSPSLNVVEHPIYDVWVKDCAMSFPGEE